MSSMISFQTRLGLDAIYVISASGSERTPVVMSRLADQGIDPTIFPARMIKSDPIRGCFESHQEIWKISLSRGYRRVLIFEDDVVFSRHPSNEELERIGHFLDRENWTVFYLGHRPRYMDKTSIPGIVTTSSHDCHAYILNGDKLWLLLRHGYSSCLGFLRGINGIDSVLSWQPHCYAIYPMMCVQDSSLPSEIEHQSRSQDGISLYSSFEQRALSDMIYRWSGWWIVLFNRFFFTEGSFWGQVMIISPLLVGVLIGIMLSRKYLTRRK